MTNITASCLKTTIKTKKYTKSYIRENHETRIRQPALWVILRKAQIATGKRELSRRLESGEG